MRQVVDLAAQISNHTSRLDVLFKNAAVFEDHRRLTGEGFEITMAVNHFAHHLLTRLLLNLLKASPQGRLVTVSSVAHEMGTLVIEDLNFERHYRGYNASAASKLANILFTRALAIRVDGTRLTANALHPDVISTKLHLKGFGITGKSVENGARTSVYLATAEEPATVTGEYFVDCAISRPSRTARKSQLAKDLWQETEKRLRPFPDTPA